MYFCCKVKSESESRSAMFDSTTPQATQSMEVSRLEYWSGQPFPSLGESSQSRDQTQVSHIAGGFFTS